MSEDTRTLADLAAEALRVQDACNLSGVVHSFARSLTRLRAILEERGKGGTDAVNRHPICWLWSDKIASLTGSQMGGITEMHDAYRAVTALAETKS
jgi:hypothetical protein